ncbi:EH domain-containing protein 1 [Aphanomyces cochlioides]|nr:EH domain-containing protein 1 [Aphanomyces cochlioides]
MLTRRVFHVRRHVPMAAIAARWNSSYEKQNEVALALMRETSRLEREVLLPLNDKLYGPLNRAVEDRLPSLPFVFLLGNHSSGKSSFINHILQRDVQSTGVAPTDDGFTIISNGNADHDQDGPALIGDPDLGFSGLRQFGPNLIQKTNLKIRANIPMGNHFMMVDSPGMIDSPASFHATSEQDRGYDFPKVVQWYAERADVILLFFDPDKPGTTGETLSILTNSLVGMDHKLHIVLNKVDQFRKIHDFARAYGSLCWNLSKVIPLKDLPRIYTMCIPVKDRGDGTKTTETGLGSALDDLESSRDEVINAVMRAPERRADNLITRVYDSSRMLEMHATVFESVRAKFSREKWSRFFVTTSALVGGNALAATAFVSGMPEVAAGASVVALAAASGISWFNRNHLAELEKELTSEDGLTTHFRRLYGRQLAERDEFVFSIWRRVLPSLQVALNTLGFSKLPKVKPSELNALQTIIQEDVPRLRRQAAPTEASVAHQVAKLLRRGF